MHQMHTRTMRQAWVWPFSVEGPLSVLVQLGEELRRHHVSHDLPDHIPGDRAPLLSLLRLVEPSTVLGREQTLRGV